MKEQEILAKLHHIIAANQQFTTWTVSTPHIVALVNYAIEEERKAAQERIDALYDMYEQACKQRDELMDQQRAQIAAMRGQIQ